MPSTNVEGGFRPQRVEFVAETTTGVTPANPTMSRYSDLVRAYGDQNLVQQAMEAVRGLGSADVTQFFRGAEDAGFNLRYALHDRALTSDVLNDAFVRDADNNIQNTHSFIAREERTLSVGADSSGSRVYLVGLGGVVTSYRLAGTLDPVTPLEGEPGYTFERARIYRIDQPSASTLIGVNSTDAADTTQSVTVEDEDAAVAQTVSLNGTTLVSMGTSQYPDIDAIALDAGMKGDLEVWINTGSHATPAKGTVLATFRGSDSYGLSAAAEGDLGVPALGSGSHASAIGGSFATLTGSTLQWGGSALADLVVNQAELRVNNMVGGQTLPTAGTRDKRILVGGTEYVISFQGVGNFLSHQNVDEHLRGLEQDFTWQIGTGANKTITISSSLKRSPGGRPVDESAAMVLSAELQGKSATIS